MKGLFFAAVGSVALGWAAPGLAQVQTPLQGQEAPQAEGPQEALGVTAVPVCQVPAALRQSVLVRAVMRGRSFAGRGRGRR